jgi:predicted Zn-dependent protease
MVRVLPSGVPAVASAERAEEKEAAAGYNANAALVEALFGNRGEARQLARSALRRATGRDVQYSAALALVLAGDESQARIVVDDLGKRFPEDTTVQFNYLPTLRAQLALSHNDARQAGVALQNATAYELGATLYPAYFRGIAYLAAHRGGDATVEFQKVLDHRGIVLNDPIGALARLGLARAYASQGNTPQVQAAYQDFLTLWKDADPDIPILKQAKAENAKLH